jgi:hypothetical protein
MSRGKKKFFKTDCPLSQKSAGPEKRQKTLTKNTPSFTIGLTNLSHNKPKSKLEETQ